jgi:hypothetical protein
MVEFKYTAPAPVEPIETPAPPLTMNCPAALAIVVCPVTVRVSVNGAFGELLGGP